VWQTYEEVYHKVMRIGSAIRSLGVMPVSEECPLMSLSKLRFCLHPENACQYENSFVESMYQGAHCGIYGSNCPEWVMAMQVTSFYFISFLSEFFFRVI